MIRKVTAIILLYAAVAMLLLANGVHAQQAAAKPAFTFQEVMISMRDGVRLQTVILASHRHATDAQGFAHGIGEPHGANLAWSIILIAACNMRLRITSRFCKNIRSRSA
ncbi:MAG TPA: hypothetical protein VKB05_09330 [Pyrinomonadaceae bacterium]|nr:hypothetical protein [Pyrinomonadaceae bacterium]